MNVAQYRFQSPSTQQVQVGRLDQNSVKEQEPKELDTQTEKTEKNSATDIKQLNNPSHLLDIYA